MRLHVFMFGRYLYRYFAQPLANDTHVQVLTIMNYCCIDILN